MIGWLKGVVLSADETRVLLDVSGVGYEVELPARHLARLEAGQTAEFVIETLVSETSLRLVGFASRQERAAFRLLQTIQGVGAKAALAILNVLTPDDLYDAVTHGDKTAVARAQGVGPKLAQRVVTELSGKIGELLTGAALPGRGDAPVPPAPGTGRSEVRRDAVLALEGLGYDTGAASRAVGTVPEADRETVEAVIAAALRGLAAT